METQNEIAVGYTTVDQNGLVTRGELSGNPTLVCMSPNVFAKDCILFQKDDSTGYDPIRWQNKGTPEIPSWIVISSGVITKKIHLTREQILDLGTTPVILIPAPGPGLTIEIVSTVVGRMNVPVHGPAYDSSVELDIAYSRT